MIRTDYPQEMAQLGKLTGAEYNPREMPEDEMQKLMNSLREFGFVQPVVARKEDGLIVGGHQRVAAMRRLLAEAGQVEAQVAAYQVPVVFIADLDDTKTKLLNLALNKIGGEWDYEKLGAMFESIPDLDPALFEVSGFSLQEVNDIVQLTAPLPQTTEPTSTVDVAEGLAEQARRLVFKLGTDADVGVVTGALKQFGMTGPGNAAQALVKMAAAVKVA